MWGEEEGALSPQVTGWGREGLAAAAAAAARPAPSLAVSPLSACPGGGGARGREGRAAPNEFHLERGERARADASPRKHDLGLQT